MNKGMVVGQRGVSLGKVGMKKVNRPSLPALRLALALGPSFMYDAAAEATPAAASKQTGTGPAAQDSDQASHEPVSGKDTSPTGTDRHVPADIGHDRR
jgi:hypothetical protein